MEQQFPLFPVILTSIPLIFIILRTGKKWYSKESTPPGPRKLPFIGNMHQLAGFIPHHRLRDLAQKYGPVMQLQIGEIPTVVISSPETAKEVLKAHDIKFTERPRMLMGEIMFYNGKDVAFAPYGDYWRQLRKICILELLSGKRVQSFRSIRQAEVSNLITTISSKAGSVINFNEMIDDFTIGIIARTSIGKKSKNQDAFLQVFKEMTEISGNTNVVDIFPSCKLIHLFSGVRYRLERSHKAADEILEAIINERKASKLVTKVGEDQNEVEDILDVLLNLQDHGDLEHLLTTESAKAVLLEMFAAGYDTSATVLQWTVSELMKNPRVMKKAQNEVGQVFNEMGIIDETGVDGMKFLKAVVKETLRLHPPVALIVRECRERCEINGYEIQTRTKVMINAWAIGRDPNHWCDAEKFYPERFLDCSIDYKGKDFELIPFGAGRRMCPGMLFGLANVEFPLACLLYHFDWKLPNGMEPENLDMTEAFGVTVRRKTNLNLIPILRHALPSE